MRGTIKNVSVIAHVDHGKTTLIDGLIRQCGLIRENQDLGERILDSNDLERERGITILSKNISIRYRDVKINIIDTPGHADFGGEVERVLSMASGVLLLVDAFEGPMPQTRFVLKKALGYGLRPVVVINKIDRSDARPHEVLDEVFDLFCRLNASDEQLDFPTVFTCARDGTATLDPDHPGRNLVPLLETIIATIPDACGDEGAPLRLQVSSIEHNEFVGRLAIGRVLAGTIRSRQAVGLLRPDGTRVDGVIGRLYTFEGLRREEAASAPAGDIVAIAGFPEIRIGDTIAEGEDAQALPPTAIDEPTLSMVFRVNDGPFSGEDGDYLTSRHLRERLEREMRRNVAMRLDDTDEPDAMRVSGRGLLHLSILIENMRREGYEFSVSNPQAIFHEVDGERHEPMELLTVDAAEDIAGRIIEIVGQRRGRLEHMEKRGDRMHLEFLIPARGLLGLRTRVLSAARGEAVLYHVFAHYEPYKGPIANRLQGVLVASETGIATAYAFRDLQERGKLFVEPGTRVYRGMIVGEHSRENDLTVNICRKKHVSNVRQSTSEKNVPLDAVARFNLEEALEYIRDDELVEVTPKAIRLRKRILDEEERKRRAREEAMGPAGAGGRPRAGSLR